MNGNLEPEENVMKEEHYIDKMHRDMIREMMDKQKEQDKFEYVFADVIQLMRNLGWTKDECITTRVIDNQNMIVIENTSKQKSNFSRPALNQNEQKPFKF